MLESLERNQFEFDNTTKGSMPIWTVTEMFDFQKHTNWITVKGGLSSIHIRVHSTEIKIKLANYLSSQMK